MRYIYIVQRETWNKDTEGFEYDFNKGDQRFFTSREKIAKTVNRWVERRLGQGCSIVSDNRDKNFTKGNEYDVTVTDGEEALKTYGYETLDKFVVKRVEVE